MVENSGVNFQNLLVCDEIGICSFSSNINYWGMCK